MSKKLKEEGFVVAVHQQNSSKTDRSKFQVFLEKNIVVILFKRQFLRDRVFSFKEGKTVCLKNTVKFISKFSL